MVLHTRSMSSLGRPLTNRSPSMTTKMSDGLPGPSAGFSTPGQVSGQFHTGSPSRKAVRLPVHPGRPRLSTFMTPVWTVSVFHVWLFSHFGAQQFAHSSEGGKQPPTGVQLPSHHQSSLRKYMSCRSLNWPGGARRRGRLNAAFLY